MVIVYKVCLLPMFGSNADKTNRLV